MVYPPSRLSQAHQRIEILEEERPSDLVIFHWLRISETIAATSNSCRHESWVVSDEVSLCCAAWGPRFPT